MRPKQNIFLTTDCAVFSKGASGIKVLLIKRRASPFKGKWALPGGFLEDEEDLESGAKRELEEETGLKIDSLQQIKAFGAPDRDPRGRTVSIAFLGTVSSEILVKAADDALEAEWFSIETLPELAFDHREILKEAVDKLKTAGSS